jgi:hypothetical protein
LICPWQNGCLQQIAANRLTIPQDVIAILLQGFVRHSWLFLRVAAKQQSTEDFG